MKPEQAVPPKAWENMGGEEKASRLSAGDAYAFTENFVYAPHELIPVETVGKNRDKTGARMIDFRDAFTVRADDINTPANSPVETKLIQLSIESRRELRMKLAHYFARVPKEDKA